MNIKKFCTREEEEKSDAEKRIKYNNENKNKEAIT